MLLGVVLASTLLLGPWLLLIWCGALAASIGGRVMGTEHRGERAGYLLAFGYLIGLSVLGVVPEISPAAQIDAAVRDSVALLLPLALPLLLLFPARAPQRKTGETFDLFYGMLVFLVLAVLVLGAARVWLFPHADGAIDNTLMWVIAMAVAGCLFVIPTAAEIPIVQTMMLAGMGTAPALALLITLPAISLPSLIMLRKSFPAKALWLTAGLVALSGVIVGCIALI